MYFVNLKASALSLLFTDSRYCDERRPICANCEARGVFCVFTLTTLDESTVTNPLPNLQVDADLVDDNRGSTSSGGVVDKAASSDMQLSFTTFQNIMDIPESRTRRMLELRLMQHFQVWGTKPFPNFAHAHVVTAWGEETPRMALRRDNLLYMMFACSATHLLQTNPEESDIAVAADVYLGLALRGQGKAVAKLSIQNADPICFTGMLLLITSMAKLWKRRIEPGEPYTPPMEWLRLGIGAGTVLAAAKEILKQDPSSKTWLLTIAPPVFDTDVLFARENLKPFSRVLELENGHETPEMVEAYKKALSYIGYVWQAVDADEPVYNVAKKIVCFALWMPRAFMDCVEEGGPRALVILAHYFAIMARYPSVWWIGRTPKREIQAIADTLPLEYQKIMRWPLMMGGLTLS